MPRIEALAVPRLADVFSVVPKEILAAIGVVVAVLVLWLWLRHARKRYVVLYRSSATDQLARELQRIADVLERMASERRPEQPTEEPRARGTLIPSMFGR